MPDSQRPQWDAPGPERRTSDAIFSSELTEQRRRTDGLFVSYGELLTQLGRFEERGDSWDEAHRTHREALKEMREQLYREVKGVSKECKDFHEEYRRDRAEELKGRVSNRTIIIALIAGSCTVLAALISAAAVVLSG